MSLDPSLKNSNKLAGRRSVLTRAERVEKMSEEGTFNPEEDSPFGLPKYRVIQSKAGIKKKEKVAKEEESAPDAEGAKVTEGVKNTEEAKSEDKTATK